MRIREREDPGVHPPYTNKESVNKEEAVAVGGVNVARHREPIQVVTSTNTTKPKAHPSHGNSTRSLVVLTDDPEEPRERLGSCAGPRDVDDHIVVAGPLDQEELGQGRDGCDGTEAPHL
jgi:hypothetical protein